MQSAYSIILSLLFSSFIIIVIITTIFSFIHFSRLVLLNALLMGAIILPPLLYHNRLADNWIMTVSTAMIFLFPLALCPLILVYTTQNNNKGLLIVGIASALFFILYHSFLPSMRIIAILCIATFAYLSFLLFRDLHDSAHRTLFSLMVFAGLIFVFLIKDFSHFEAVIAVPLVTLFSIIIQSYNLRRRITQLFQRYNSLLELNNRLNYKLLRFKQSNDQVKKILIEKEYELLQLSRHASLAELTTGIAHELLQPLTGIKGIAQNMIDDINYEDFDSLQGVSELMKISSLVDKSSSIITHIKDFSRKNIIAKKPLELNTVILEAIDLINLQLKKNNIDLIFVLDDTIPRIFGDKIALEQLILNLVLNSRDAIMEKMSQNDHNGIIRLSTSSDSSKVLFRVEDNGGGISEEIINRIWHPFFTTKKKFAGTGIGLSISQRIIKDHAADVRLDTDENGTVFTIVFPALEQ